MDCRGIRFCRTETCSEDAADGEHAVLCIEDFHHIAGFNGAALLKIGVLIAGQIGDLAAGSVQQFHLSGTAFRDAGDNGHFPEQGIVRFHGPGVAFFQGQDQKAVDEGIAANACGQGDHQAQQGRKIMVAQPADGAHHYQGKQQGVEIKGDHALPVAQLQIGAQCPAAG